MKAKLLLLAVGLSLNVFAQNQSPSGTAFPPGAQSATPVEVTPFTITQSGPHHRVWEKVLAYTNAQGGRIYRTNSYVEMGTGLNIWTGSQWADASDQIQITPAG